MAFTIPLTIKLSGATKSQLAHWRRTGVLEPEVESRHRPLLYSYRDLVALRSFAHLRQKVSLQLIRKALNSLLSMDMFEHPAAYTFVTDGKRISLAESQEAQIDLTKQPGTPTFFTLEDVLSAFENKSGDLIPDLRHPTAHIEIDQDRLGGWPTIVGTRVPYDEIADLIGDGTVSPERVAYYYPGISAAQARDALRFAEQLAS
jgi:uncharacterized protein (DUF433 family)